VTEEEITEAQRRIGPRSITNRTRRDYRVCARWYELNAKRGYQSAHLDLEYAENMRWLAELVTIYGEGTPLELFARSGIPNPYIGKAPEQPSRPPHLRSFRVGPLPAITRLK
jgi:hypothetical protein